MTVDERRIPDPFLDEIIQSHKMVRIFLFEISFDESSDRTFVEGSVSSYSALGVAVVLLDGRRVWLHISRVEAIEEIDSSGGVNCRR